jgi:hypothetical protein
VRYSNVALLAAATAYETSPSLALGVLTHTT